MALTGLETEFTAVVTIATGGTTSTSTKIPFPCSLMGITVGTAAASAQIQIQVSNASASGFRTFYDAYDQAIWTVACGGMNLAVGVPKEVSAFKYMRIRTSAAQATTGLSVTICGKKC